MSILLFLFKIVFVILLFLVIEWLAYKTTEVWYDKIFTRFPFLDHKPWNCRLCLQWWANVFFAVVFLLVTRWYAPTIIWLVIALLETAALKIDENNRYISDDFYEDGDLEDN